ncbi:soluble lytic murein transglycosylase precursor [hydrocarbon metagenome]|uniref:Soluble lytic murein transglycosylase n=1 Tax=hydrocarbon metagenome TaxID=938273 RepID=A0A0W8FU88_9ZZZZ
MKVYLKILFINFGRSLFLRIAVAVLAAFIITTANIAHADIYKYVDEEGVLHLTNVPTDHKVKYVLILKEKRILFNANLDVTKYDELITKAANKFKLDSALIKAVIKAESNFNHRAVSRVGAQGLMQLMPSTASALNVDDSFHPEKNIEGGARYLRYLINTYKGDLTLALAAYNAGEKAVSKYNYNIPPYRETQNYVKRVLSFYKSYSNL